VAVCELYICKEGGIAAGCDEAIIFDTEGYVSEQVERTYSW
jgi:hypothetical protein